MKKYTYFVIAAALAFALFSASTPEVKEKDAPKGKEVTWMTDYEAAVDKASKEDKHLLLNFTGSDWCGWCIKLDKEVFSKEAFADYANDNLVLVKLDFPRKTKLSEELQKQNYGLAQQFKVRGYPTIYVLDPEKKVATKTGYQKGGAESYVKHLKEIISNQAADN